MSEKNCIAEQTFSIRWTDMDTYGHVTNSAYFKYLTNLRHDILLKPFLPHSKVQFLVVHTQCDFKLPVQYPAALTAKHYLEKMGNSSFVLSCDFFNAQGQLCTSAQTTLATVDNKNFKPTAIPAEIKTILGEGVIEKPPRHQLELSGARLLNTIKIPLRWVDMNAGEHVDNAIYFEFMIEARCALFPNSDLRNDLCLFFLIATDCTFHKPLIYPDAVIVKQYLLHVGSSSLNFAYQFFAASAPDTLYAEGKGVMVCVDPKTHKPIPVAKQLMERLLNNPIGNGLDRPAGGSRTAPTS